MLAAERRLLVSPSLSPSAFDYPVTSTIATGNGPDGIAVKPVTNRIYLLNAVARSVSVIDGSTDTLLATEDLGTYGTYEPTEIEAIMNTPAALAA